MRLHKFLFLFFLDSASLQDSDMDYKLEYTKSGRIGRALIIINEKFDDESFNPPERAGAKVDREHLEKMFTLLRIEYFNCTNLTGKEMEDEIKKFAEKSVDASVIFLAISSHGNEDNIIGVGHVPTKDDFLSVTKIQEIFNQFDKLNEIPKVLILQACRGGEKQEVDAATHLPVDPNPIDFSVISKDTLIIFPTSLHHPAFRSARDGTWLIERLYKCVSEYKETLHFTEIMIVCTHKIIQNYQTRTKETQTCTFKSSLTKFLRFKDV